MELGGAELQLAMLANAMASRGHAVTVLTFYPGQENSRLQFNEGVVHRVLGKAGRWDIVAFLSRLRRAFADASPDVIHSFLGPPNVAAALARRKGSGGRLIWGIRASNMDAGRYDWAHVVALRLERMLATRADLIVANSTAGKEHAIRQGMRAGKVTVVGNGIDVVRFCRRRDEARKLRTSWLGPFKGPLIGLVARLDPMKDHPTFLHAAMALVERMPEAVFVCLGGGSQAYGAAMRRLAVDLGLQDRIRWSEPVDNVEVAMNAFDLVTLTSSYGEGFPNVLAEAIACEVPVVATDVGDARRIVSDDNRIVRPGEPDALAAAWYQSLQQTPELLAQTTARHRKRIVRDFSHASLLERMEKIYAEL
ncbi:MAG: glycosyltransferase [Alphaproteobacteria bacterium]